jgi:hypothetical protein
MAVVDVFADTGMLAYRDGVLPDALRELSVRLDLAGAGPLLDQIMQLDWTDPPAAGDKRDPKPKPTPKPPPKPKP